MNDAGAAAELRAALNAALEMLRGGNAAEAERQARAVMALARAARDVSELANAAPLLAEEDDEAMRAELRRRFDRFLEADRAGSSAEELERRAREMFAE